MKLTKPANREQQRSNPNKENQTKVIRKKHVKVLTALIDSRRAIKRDQRGTYHKEVNMGKKNRTSRSIGQKLSKRTNG